MFLTRGIWWIWPRKVQPETFWMEPAFFKRELILKNIQVKRVPIPSDGLIRNSLCFITRSKHRIINPFYRSHPSAPHRPCYVVIIMKITLSPYRFVFALRRRPRPSLLVNLYISFCASYERWFLVFYEKISVVNKIHIYTQLTLVMSNVWTIGVLKYQTVNELTVLPVYLFVRV